MQAPGAAANGVFYSTAKLPAVTYYQMEQEFPTLFLWNDLESIVVTAIGLPVRGEYLPPINGQNNQIPILTDFQPLITAGPEVRSNIQYFPSGPYRLIDMESNVPLKSLGIQLYWTNHNNDLFPIYLSPGRNASIKLLFQRKGAPYNTYKSMEMGGIFEHSHVIHNESFDQYPKGSGLMKRSIAGIKY